MREDDHDIEPPIDQLCERIVARHHAYLRRTLPIVVADLARLGDGDGAKRSKSNLSLARRTSYSQISVSTASR